MIDTIFLDISDQDNYPIIHIIVLLGTWGLVILGLDFPKIFCIKLLHHHFFLKQSQRNEVLTKAPRYQVVYVGFQSEARNKYGTRAKEPMCTFFSDVATAILAFLLLTISRVVYHTGKETELCSLCFTVVFFFFFFWYW